MNKLWVWLSLLLGLVTASSVGAVSLLARQYVNVGFRSFLAVSQIQETGLDSQLAGYYGRTGSWRGVERIVQQARDPNAPADAPPRNLDMGRVRLTDAAGELVYPPDQALPLDPPPTPVGPPNGRAGPPPFRPSPDEAAIPLEWQGQAVGTLWVRILPADPLGRAADSFLTQVNGILLQAGAVVGGVGLLLGSLLARRLTAPLGQIQRAAERIAAGQLEQQVPVQGAAEIARLAQAFNAMAAGLRQGEQVRRNMVSDIAHELRTPISVLQGNLQALLDGVYPLEVSEIATLADETRILSRLVTDLYDLAQAEAGQLRLHYEAVALEPLAQTVTALFSEAARGEGLTLSLRPDPNLPLVWADPARVQQVLTNLVSNAVRYTPVGGTVTVLLATVPAPSVTTGQSRSPVPAPPLVRVEVADSGPGLGEAEAAQVFERFWRADAARARETGGAGLGLAIARQLVEAQGGQIGVISGPGQGSRFWFTLPQPASR